MDLLAAAIVSGFLATARHWLRVTAAGTTPDRQQVWEALLERMLGRLRQGYWGR